MTGFRKCKCTHPSSGIFASIVMSVSAIETPDLDGDTPSMFEPNWEFR